MRPATAAPGAPLAARRYADARTLSTAVIAAIIIGGVDSNLRKNKFNSYPKDRIDKDQFPT